MISVVPSEDEHQVRSVSSFVPPGEAWLNSSQSEYVGASDQRREYISGSVHALTERKARSAERSYRFNGSAGTAVIPSSSLDTDALLFVDSRYWIQAEKQVPKKGWKVVRVGSSGGSGAASVEKGWTEWMITVNQHGSGVLPRERLADSSQSVKEGSKVGIDPRLVSLSEYRRCERTVRGLMTRRRLQQHQGPLDR